MTQIEKKIENFYNGKLKHVQDTRDRIASGDLMEWDDAMRLREGDYINYKGNEIRIDYLGYRGLQYGFIGRYFHAFIDGNPDRKITGIFAIQLPRETNWMEMFWETKKEMTEFLNENELKFREFFEKNKERKDVYGFKVFETNCFDMKKEVDEDERLMYKMFNKLISTAARLYEGDPDNHGEYIKFMDSETQDRLEKDYAFTEAYKGPYMGGPWWKHGGWLTKIAITRYSNTFGHRHFDNSNTSAPMDGIDVQLKSYAYGTRDICLGGTNGYNIEPFTNPMKIAQVGIALMEKIRNDFNIK